MYSEKEVKKEKENEKDQDSKDQDKNGRRATDSKEKEQAAAAKDENGAQDKDTAAETKSQDTAVEPHGRDGASPSNILEKGIIYFFYRGRIDTEHPEKVDDLARTHIILRPIPNDAKLTDGPIGDAGNSRLLAIPKKKLPQTGRDRWIAFVEKTNASFDQLKKEFLASDDYTTQAGLDRHVPAAAPFGEGVYAITSTGRESHLAYFLTLPEKLGNVQSEIGLKEKGSWILSTRNPQYPAPKNAQLPGGPEFSQEVSEAAVGILERQERYQ